MRNKLLRRGRRLNEAEQIRRLEMIQEDIKYLERIFGYVPVENEVTNE